MRLPSAALLACLISSMALADADDADGGDQLPTGLRITPTAATGAVLQRLEIPGGKGAGAVAGQPVSLAATPDGRELFVLTTGYNLVRDETGKTDPAQSREHLFVYDIGNGRPVELQDLPIPNSFLGLAVDPSGQHLYVGGGVDDDVHVFARDGMRWAEAGAPIALNHPTTATRPAGTAGMAVAADGKTLVVADLENDAISIVDLATRAVRDLDLRPGAGTKGQRGRPGGSYPIAVALTGDTAFVASARDRELVIARIGTEPEVVGRVPLPGNPTHLLFDRSGERLFIAQDNEDAVSVFDPASRRITLTIRTTAPKAMLRDRPAYRGASPNFIALSPDEARLYVTNGGANDLAVIDLDRKHPQVTGLVPTGWYPNAVAALGDMLYVVNGRSDPGPDPRNCNLLVPKPDQDAVARRCSGPNQYPLALDKGGLLSLPIPKSGDLDELTRRVAANNFYDTRPDPGDEAVMRTIRRKIRHVIYIVKENRTYDQVLGDLPGSDGDPALAEFGSAVTPNQHALASGFAALDNFMDAGEVSGNGWPWSTAARESDIGVKTIPAYYARRGYSYDVEGQNRGVNVGMISLSARRKADPAMPSDPDLLPGTGDVTAPDSTAGERQRGYLWDAALRAGLTVRNYGFFVDLSRYNPKHPQPIPLERMPADTRLTVAYVSSPVLGPLSDPYFRGFDPRFPDLYREQDWEREFDAAEVTGKLAGLSLVRLGRDHLGAFEDSIDGVDTPETQIADNDYALGRLVERVAHSRFRDSTLIVAVEDDAQDGPDHVDAHRSIAFVAGPYLRHGVVIHTRYSTVNLLRTIEEVLGLEPLSLNDAYQRPMTDLFDPASAEWSFTAEPAAILRSTKLPLPQKEGAAEPIPLPSHDAHWWQARTQDFDFSSEDRVDPVAFNRVLWDGLMPGRDYPVRR